jgi:hypothetical protein
MFYGDAVTNADSASLRLYSVYGYRWAAGARMTLKSYSVSDWEYEVYQSDLEYRPPAERTHLTSIPSLLPKPTTPTPPANRVNIRGRSYTYDPDTGKFTLVNPDEAMSNEVIVEYGAGSLTSAADDTTSQARYGKRVRKVKGGTSTTATAAARLRDRILQMEKDEVWRGNSITLSRQIRRKGGIRCPLWKVRAGERVKMCNVNWPDGYVFVIGSAEYDAEADTLSISPLDTPDRVELWISRLQAKQKE